MRVEAYCRGGLGCSQLRKGEDVQGSSSLVPTTGVPGLEPEALVRSE